MVRIQLGHAESIDDPLGRNSTAIPAETLHTLSEHLETIASSVGWKALPHRQKTDQLFSRHPNNISTYTDSIH